MAIVEDDSKRYKVFRLLLLESSNELFFSYLTNREVGVLDRVITNVDLRRIYFREAAHFYLNNKIQSLAELKWILKRNIHITKCHMDFELEGKSM